MREYTLADLETFSREEFLTRRWRYRPGEHVTILGPTGTGKTWLGYQLLEHTVSPDLPALVLVMKPRDATVTSWSRRVGFRRVRSWPVPWNVFGPRRTNGWVIWPPHTFNPDIDDPRMYQIFRRALLDSYKRGNRIVFADEAYGLSDELGLDREMITLWTRGRSMGTGEWVASQKPTHIPLHAYNQVQHLFLFRDPDKRARDRYSEISGVNPALVRDAVLSLRRHQCLYIRQDGPRMCIVDK